MQLFNMQHVVALYWYFWFVRLMYVWTECWVGITSTRAVGKSICLTMSCIIALILRIYFDTIHSLTCYAIHRRRHSVWETCRSSNISSLAERRFEFYRTVFQQIIGEKFHILHYLLPHKHDVQLTDRPATVHVHQRYRGLRPFDLDV